MKSDSERKPGEKRLLVTAALPYANGHIHLGHMVEYTLADIFVRFQRMTGRNAIYICADDTHGAAITISARKEGRSEEEFIRDMSIAHQRDFAAFGISFDHFDSTNSPENRVKCDEIWAALKKHGRVREGDVAQLFDPEAGVFLADRFVKGKCPKCGTPDQYGDSCESCGSTYAATDLVEPRSVNTGAKPEVRSARHYFVQIEPERPFLTEWTQTPGRLPKEIANYLMGFFLNEPLRDWDVSRPAPYFGFEIPDAPGHYWYVWFDAPIGYVASTQAWCDKTGERFDDWWKSDGTEIVHVIGKDIVYFHTLFWPTMLKAAGLSLPTREHVHGFLTVDGAKMSKSRGTFVLASTYLKHLDPSYLRYYFASKLSNKVDDIDLNLEELVAKVNAELVNKVVNLASRSAKFAEKTGLSPDYPDDGGLFARAAAAGDEIAEAYADFDFARAVRTIIALADRANEYVDKAAPWSLAKQPGKETEVRDVVTISLNLYRQIALYLAPVLPRLAEESGKLLGVPMTSWSEAKTPSVGGAIGKYEHLMKRVDEKAIAQMVEDSKVSLPQAPEPQPGVSAPDDASSDDGAALAAEPIAAECTIDDFAKIDMRVARVLKAEELPEAKKLLKLTVSLGGGNERTVFAGIKAYYKPEALVGRLVVIAANLAPRKMKLGTSEGMVLAAGGADSVFVLAPDSGAKPGMRVH